MRCHCSTTYRPCARCHRLFAIPVEKERYSGKPQRYCSRYCFGHDTHNRFWQKVQKTNGCWVWTGARGGKGYGIFNPRRGEQLGAHRFSWQLAHGEIPSGLYVCHRCDNPACVRPDHLFLGTQADNIADMFAKGRQAPPEAHRARGERHPNAVLTDNQVREIRRRYADEPITHTAFANEYGVSRATIYLILSRRSWKHIT